MAGVFLHLEIDTKGVKAKIIEHSLSQTIIKDECQVLYENLAPSEEAPAVLETAMDLVDEQLDLSVCATAVILVSATLCSFRNLNLPFGSEKKIRQVLPFELESLLPLSEVEYISDFHLLTSQDSDHLILSASIQESLIDEYFSILAKFDIKPLIISCTGYAAAIAFLNLQKENQNFAFLHIGGNDITMVIVNDLKPSVVRSFFAQNTGPQQIAKKVHQALIGFSHRTGIQNDFKLFISSDDDDMVHSAIYTAFDQLMGNELQVSPHRYKIEAEGLICSVFPEQKTKYLFNFCTGKYRTSSLFDKYRSNIILASVLFVCAFTLMLINVGYDNAVLAKQVAQLDRQALDIYRQAFPKKRVVNDAYLEMKANVRVALKNSGSDGQARSLSSGRDIKMVHVLAELSQKIDANIDMEISRFLYNNGKLILSGATDNFNNVDRIKSRLETSALFKTVTISTADSDKRENRVNFKFIIDF